MNAVYKVAELIRPHKRLPCGFIVANHTICDVGIGVQPVFKIPVTNRELLQNIDKAILVTRLTAPILSIKVIEVVCGRECPERASTSIVRNLLHLATILKRLYRRSVLLTEVGHLSLNLLQTCGRLFASCKLDRATLRRLSRFLLHFGNTCGEGGPQSAATKRCAPYGRFSHRHRPLLSSIWNSPGCRHQARCPIITRLPHSIINHIDLRYLSYSCMILFQE